MNTYAVLNGDTVINTIIADTLSDAELGSGNTCVEYTELNPAGIGWTYNGTTFTAPIETSTPVDTTNTTTQ
jgi:hypothetical protein